MEDFVIEGAERYSIVAMQACFPGKIFETEVL